MTDSATPTGSAPEGADPEALRQRALAALLTARERTALLTDSVDDHELTAQHSPLMSPLVWDLAHIGNQEELWLLRAVAGREAMRPEIDGLYDAFEHPRATRPSLPLLAPAEARTYAAEVRGRALDVLDGAALDGGGPLVRSGFAFGMIAQHEQQHDETMLITHQLRSGTAVLTAPVPPAATDTAGLPAEVLVPGGPFTMGTSTEPWALDNERPAHVRDVPGFFIDTTPVTCGAYQAFIEDGGYTERRWWEPGGWEMVREHELTAPLFWHRDSRPVAAPPFRGHRGGARERAGAPCQLVRGRCVRPLGRATAAHGSGVGEGGAPRPGVGAFTALPLGRRGPVPGAGEPGAAPSAARTGRCVPAGTVSLRRTAVDG